jgi:hypothetical protein
MPGLDETLAGPGGPAQPVVRIGTVVASPAPTAAVCWVEMAAGQPPIDMPFVTSYVPVAGDKVEVLFASAGNSMQGIVVGGQASQSGNMVVNGNFYRAPLLDFPPINNPPYHWFRYVASGNAGVVCQAIQQTYQRLVMVVQAVSGVSSGDTFAYSSAIPVVAGSSYKVTSIGVASTAVLTTLTLYSRIAWFADSVSVYPNFLAETQFGTDVVGASATQNIYEFGTVTAPAGATFARFVMRNQHVGTGAGSGSSMWWSEATMLRA